MEPPRLNSIAPASEVTDASIRRHLYGVRLLLVTIPSATILFLLQIEIFIRLRCGELDFGRGFLLGGYVVSVPSWCRNPLSVALPNSDLR